MRERGTAVGGQKHHSHAGQTGQQRQQQQIFPPREQQANRKVANQRPRRPLSAPVAAGQIVVGSPLDRRQLVDGYCPPFTGTRQWSFVDENAGGVMSPVANIRTAERQLCRGMSPRTRCRRFAAGYLLAVSLMVMLTQVTSADANSTQIINRNPFKRRGASLNERTQRFSDSSRSFSPVAGLPASFSPASGRPLTFSPASGLPVSSSHARPPAPQFSTRPPASLFAVPTAQTNIRSARQSGINTRYTYAGLGSGEAVDVPHIHYDQQRQQRRYSAEPAYNVAGRPISSEVAATSYDSTDRISVSFPKVAAAVRNLGSYSRGEVVRHSPTSSSYTLVTRGSGGSSVSSPAATSAPPSSSGSSELSPAPTPLQLLLSRRQLWQAESEDNIHLSRPNRDPSSSPQTASRSFAPFNRDDEVEVLRGSYQELPQSAALRVAVPNQLLEPVPAVPHLPLLRPVPAVPSLPTLSTFTTAKTTVPPPTTTTEATTITTTTPTTYSQSIAASTLSPIALARTSPRSPLNRGGFAATLAAFRGRQRTTTTSTTTAEPPSTELFTLTESSSALTSPTTQSTVSRLRGRINPTLLARISLGRDGPAKPADDSDEDSVLSIRSRQPTINRSEEDEEALTTVVTDDDRLTTEIRVATTVATTVNDPPPTTLRSAEILSQLLESTTTRPTTIQHPNLGRVLSDDPCLEGNHEVLAGQPHRSFNHHLSVGNLPPVCDRQLATGWYRFESPAGNLLPTECPGGNYCGTQVPVWMKGSVPHVSEGIVDTTACINQDRECCVAELDIKVRNCSSFVAYYLVPTPGCNMGYCVGEGVPCPPGLASTNGYTPCDFTVKMKTVELSQTTNALQSEILFHCSPILEHVIEPASLELEVMWYVDEVNVLSEIYEAGSKSASILPVNLWKMGQTIRCEAQAKHNVVGARTEKKSSPHQFAGLRVTSPLPLEVKEGASEPTMLTLESTVPVLCSPQDRAFGDCCVELELTITEVEQRNFCPNGNTLDMVLLPSCRYKICKDDWNKTHQINVEGAIHRLINTPRLAVLDIRTGHSSTSQWEDYVLPVQELRIVPANIEEHCVSDGRITTFDSVEYSIPEQGSYLLYRHKSRPYEVQVYYRHCNLREICHCAISIRVEDITVTMDICSRGYLQVWILSTNGEPVEDVDVPEGFRLNSINEGRAYEIEFPTGTLLRLGPYLTYITILPSPADRQMTEGLCGTFDPTELKGGCKNEDGDLVDCNVFAKKWRHSDGESLFNGFVSHHPNQTKPLFPRMQSQCACKLDEEREESVSNEISSGSDRQTSGDFNGGRFFHQINNPNKEDGCLMNTCTDGRAVPVLEKYLKISADDDLKILSLSGIIPKESEESQVSTVTVVGGPVVNRPQEGWTSASAASFCSEFIRSSQVIEKCVDMIHGVLGQKLTDILDSCTTQVMYTGDSRYAMLQLYRMKEECRELVMRNTSMWTREASSVDPPAPPRDIVDTLCINDCSGHGHCSQGVCLCGDSYAGADCSIDLRSGPRVASLGNSGLCDVRTRPCRNILVLGDNFANLPDLSCHFEVFKIRGVASKQLVQDLVLTSAATFVSFQQILCPLPTLDIHSNKERHRFDLRDNTDQTRMFVKVSVSYETGAKSAPLDLLLYDSQCWHCSYTGECNAKSNNKCVFSAATSSVQTFRLGKSIASEKDDLCSLPHDSGGCDRKEFRYYYNSLERRCKLFVYGGCKGNQNNFLSEIECVRRCGDEVDHGHFTDITAIAPPEIDQCSQVKDEGICPGNVPRFYFDTLAGRCLLFSYGGCGGNTNNFLTEEACISRCGGPTGALLHAIQLHGVLKPRKEICSLAINKGGCQAKLRRFYFDERDETCKLFVFGGCQGNENNFETMEDCVINCGGPKPPSSTSATRSFLGTEAGLDTEETETESTSTEDVEVVVRTTPISVPDLTTAGRLSNAHTVPVPTISSPPTGPGGSVHLPAMPTTSMLLLAARKANLTAGVTTTTRKPSTRSPDISFTSISLPSISPCGLPKQVGTCNSYRDRYYFDPNLQLCKKFRFSGCGGNGNNFLTGENCVKNCGGKIEDFIISKKHITERIVIPTMKTTTTTSTTPSTTILDTAATELISTVTSVTEASKGEDDEVEHELHHVHQHGDHEDEHEENEEEDEEVGDGEVDHKRPRKMKRVRVVPRERFRSLPGPDGEGPGGKLVARLRGRHKTADSAAGETNNDNFAEASNDYIVRTRYRGSSSAGRQGRTRSRMSVSSSSVVTTKSSSSSSTGEGAAPNETTEESLTAAPGGGVARGSVLRRGLGRRLPTTSSRERAGQVRERGARYRRPARNVNFKDFEQVPGLMPLASGDDPTHRHAGVLQSSTLGSDIEEDLLPGVRAVNPLTRVASHRQYSTRGSEEGDPRGLDDRGVTKPALLFHRGREVNGLSVISKGTVRVDKVVKAPPNMKGGLVIIKSFCRYPPLFSSQSDSQPPTEVLATEAASSCSPAETIFYYYDITTATCLPFRSSTCVESKNRFASADECLSTCIVNKDQ